MKCAADGTYDAYGFILFYCVVSRETAGILRAFDVIDAVADLIWNLVSEVRGKHLLEIYCLSVIAFNSHADISARGDVSIEGTFFMISDVHLNVDDLTRKAVIGKVSEKPERGEENKGNEDYQSNGDNRLELRVRRFVIQYAN